MAIGRPSTRRPIAIALAVTLAAAALGWGGLSAVRGWQYDRDLAAARRDLATGRPAEARDRLARLAARRPDRDDVAFDLGVAEAGLGHVGPALDAWGLVPDSSPLAPRAALSRAKLALDHGRLAVAEEALARFRSGGPGLAEEAARLADQVDLYLGRLRPIADRIERVWTPAPDGAAARLRTHWLFETQPPPVGPVEAALERMGRESPEDDRVWLGRAAVATELGRFDEADAWLARCEARRPDDRQVLRARLAWALASGRLDAARGPASRLPSDAFSAPELASISARVANLRGDVGAERHALEWRVALEPGDASAWGRIADLAARDGRSEARAKALGRKAEIDRAKDRYRMLMGGVARGETEHYADLAQSAEVLGRWFEAQSWWSLQLRLRPGEPEARAGLARVLHSSATSEKVKATELLVDFVPGLSGGAVATVVDGPEPPQFVDDAARAGLAFVYENDPTSLRRLPETMGGGVGLIDFDGDGRLDVYAVQGGPFPGGSTSPAGGDRLFRNRGDGTFEDATARSGIAGFRRGFGHGVAVGDYDNDGRPDLFVTRWRSYALYHNKGDGTFEDATDRDGLGGERGWPTSSAFADLDGDGDLDLYVCHYAEWDPDRSAPCPDPEHPGRFMYCVPKAFAAQADHLFRNDGGKFVDVTKEAGIVDRDGRGLGVVVADLDDDGRPDVYVANDMSANYLFRNLGGMKFEEVGEASGCASNAEGGYQAGMGVACGDLDGDGLPDLAVTNFYGESTTLYRNLGGGLFADRTVAAHLAAPTRHVLGFGAWFFDADRDGRLDLAQANGHVNDFRPSTAYAMPAQLFLGATGGRLVDASSRAGACWSTLRVGRGMAVGDLDDDGREDVLILAQGGPLAYFRNLGPVGRSLTLRLEGTASNRDAVGAKVVVRSGGRTRTAWRLGGGSFLSACDGRLHFGLGAEAGHASVEVRWPSGRIDRHEGLKPDAAYHLVEGRPEARALP